MFCVRDSLAARSEQGTCLSLHFAGDVLPGHIFRRYRSDQYFFQHNYFGLWSQPDTYLLRARDYLGCINSDGRCREKTNCSRRKPATAKGARTKANNDRAGAEAGARREGMSVLREKISRLGHGLSFGYAGACRSRKGRYKLKRTLQLGHFRPLRQMLVRVSPLHSIAFLILRSTFCLHLKSAGCFMLQSLSDWALVGIMHITPHLCFDGQCRAAFAIYQQILGGKIQTMLTYGESPMAARVESQWRDRILHASLQFGDIELTGVDLLPRDYRKPQGFFVTLTIEGATRADQIFASLADGGQVRLPFQPTFWSPGFGVVVDRFAIPWEVSSVEAAIASH